jgi:hypothetical protein
MTDNTNGGQEAMLWSDSNIIHTHHTVLGEYPQVDILAFIRTIRDDMQARIAELEAELEVVTQDAMTQNNEVVRLQALVQQILSVWESSDKHARAALEQLEQPATGQQGQWEPVPNGEYQGTLDYTWDGEWLRT